MNRIDILERKLALQKQLVQVQAGSSLLSFAQYTKPDYSVNWHHREICRLLDLFAEGHIKKLMIFTPPQVGKSELSSRRFPAYYLGKNPHSKVALASYSSSLSKEFSRNVKAIIASPEYRDVFPNTRLGDNKEDKEAANRAEYFEVVGSSGYFISTSVGGALTGKTVDVGIIDDPVKDRIEANSSTYRNRVWSWYTDVFCSRLHNESQQLILMTRWHEDDLAGRILAQEADEWTVIKLPAIREVMDGNPYDPRQIGEALWPEKHSLDRYLKIKKNNPSTWSSLYQQEPAPLEGAIIKASHLTIIDPVHIPHEVLKAPKHIFFDGAYTEKSNNDPSAWILASEYEGFLFIFDYVNVRLEFPDLINGLGRYCAMYCDNRSEIWIEPKASGLSVGQTLEKKMPGYNILYYKLPKGSKVDRTLANEPKYASHKIFLVRGAWNAGFIHECKSFPNGLHDEAVDVTNMAVDEKLMKRELIREWSGDLI